MKRLVRAGTALAGLVALTVGLSAPANAVYVVTWYYYGNPVAEQWVCDDNTLYATIWGTPAGTPVVTGWYPGEGPC